MSNSANQPTLLAAGRLVAVFTRQGDRVGHRVEVLHDRGNAAASVMLLQSVEGSGDDDWPPSPPFRDLHVEQREAGRTIAFLVGMAGSSHWSASIEADPVAALLSFDIACRLRTIPPWLGSQYEVLANWSKIVGGADLQLGRDSVALRTQAGETLLVHEPGQLRIQAVSDISRASFPVTLRWRYSVSLSQPG